MNDQLYAIPSAKALKQKLYALSADILAPGDFHDRLAPAVMNYANMLFDIANINTNEDVNREHIFTGHGQAVSPFAAAFCTREVIRTQRFCRGLYNAVSNTLKSKPGPVHVVYAGTGPFAALALPVMLQFTPQQLQFTLLEINSESMKRLKALLNLFELESYVRSIELCDAITWKAPEDRIDIALSETMNNALLKEPQINIMLNMVKQLPEDVVYIPEEITVRIAYHRKNIFKPIAPLYTFKKETYQQIISQSAGKTHWVFDTTNIDYLPVADSEIVYTTDIKVYGDDELCYPDCSLNLPARVKTALPFDKAVLQFQYQDGDQPGFEMQVSEVEQAI